MLIRRGKRSLKLLIRGIFFLCMAGLFACTGADDPISDHTNNKTSRTTDLSPKLEFRLAWDEPGPNRTAATDPDDGRTLYMSTEPLLTGVDVMDALLVLDHLGQPAISITLHEDASNRLEAATGKHLDKPVVILVDDKILSTPIIKSPMRDSILLSGALPENTRKKLLESLGAR